LSAVVKAKVLPGASVIVFAPPAALAALIAAIKSGTVATL
jgi:hypothetical protein